MAEAVARHELGLNDATERGGSVVAGGKGEAGMAHAGTDYRVLSAGVSAADERTGGGGGGGTGAGGRDMMTTEARRALEALGVSAPRHVSRALTRRLIAEADVIFTMSGSHLRAVLEMDPDAVGKARTLDPAGADIPDPIGSSFEVYARTARRIQALVRTRIQELRS